MCDLCRKSLGFAILILTLAGCYTNTFASVVRSPHQSRGSNPIQNKIDSIQQWAHNYCDSVLNSFHENFKTDHLEKEYLKELLKHRLDSLGTNPFFSGSPNMDGSMNGFIFGNEKYGPMHRGPDGRNYYLQVVPGSGSKGIHVKGNLWQLDSEEASGRFR